MKVAICGAGESTRQEVEEKAFEIGRHLAEQGVLVLTGGCHGYPLKAAEGAVEGGGPVLAVSPAKDQQEHEQSYKFPLKPFTQIEYTGMGIPARNYALVTEADAVIIIGGQTGTLNEFTIAFHQRKPIGVLQGSGGMTSLLPQLAATCEKQGESKLIIYEHKPLDLVQKLLAKLEGKNS